MGYKIVVDSCCEFPDGCFQNEKIEVVPLGLEVGDYRMMDDENFNQAQFLKMVAECPFCPKSSCPSPERFLEAYCTDAEHVFVITISSKLSGTYNSALLGKALYEEKYGTKQIHVVDSKSACSGETQLALKIMELEEQELSFEEIVERIERFRDELGTYFVLDNLETLRKNGRLSKMKAMMASTLNIKPYMCAEEGEIIQRGQAIGKKKALSKMVDLLLAETTEQEKKKLVIAHCNARESAEFVRDLLMKKGKFSECYFTDTQGIGSMYANDGGVIVSV